MARPGPQFSFEQMATSLRGQASMSETLRRFASSGDVVPYTVNMGAATTAPPGWAGITGFYVRSKDSVFATFTGTYSGAGVGVGAYSMPLPVPNYWNAKNGTVIGQWWATAGASEANGIIRGTAGGGAALSYRTANPGAVTNVGPAAPYAWAAGNILEGWLMYLAAKSA